MVVIWSTQKMNLETSLMETGGGNQPRQAVFRTLEGSRNRRSSISLFYFSTRSRSKQCLDSTRLGDIIYCLVVKCRLGVLLYCRIRSAIEVKVHVASTPSDRSLDRRAMVIAVTINVQRCVISRLTIARRSSDGL